MTENNKRGDESAFPVTATEDTPPAYGLTIREYTVIEMAKAILTGTVARGCPSTEWTDNFMAIKCADLLLAELSKESP